MAIIERVVIDRNTSGDIGAVEDVFRRAGHDIAIEDQLYEPSGGEAITWVVHLALGTTLGGFFAAMGADAFKKFKALTHDLWDRQDRRDIELHQVVVHGPNDDESLVLPLPLPNEAFDALASLDWSDGRSGLISWEEDSKRWSDRRRRS